MKCKECGDELQKVAILGNTKKYSYYCNTCAKAGKKLKDCMSDEVFTANESWRPKFTGKSTKKVFG